MSLGLNEQYQFEQSMKKLLSNLSIAARFILYCAGAFQIIQFLIFLLKIATRP